MPNVAIFFLILLVSPIITNSYAFPIDELNSLENPKNPITFNSDIMQVDPNFFVENNFKRYLIFGSHSSDIDSLKKNSLFGIQSDHGFFYVSLLSSQSASNLISAGYHVIEDVPLDFHSSDKIFSDVSRIGEITGSTIANQKYNATGNNIVIAIVDTGVDFSNPDIQHSLSLIHI